MKRETDKKKKLKSSTDPDMANKLAARSALLDFYSDKAAAFAGFFIASIFGLLTMLALVQGIKSLNLSTVPILFGLSIDQILVILSFFPVLVFAYMGNYVIRRFNHYSVIADMIEMGDGTKKGNGLRYSAALEEVYYNVHEKGKDERKKVSEVMGNRSEKQRKTIGKRVVRNSSLFRTLYWLLILVLIIVTYGPYIPL
jgi:hypothetical protein